MSTLTFQNIVDDGALLFLETHHFQDERFEEWGYQRWYTEDALASLNLHFAERMMTVKDTVFLGTAGPGPRTFLWAWANPGVSPTSARQAVFEQIANFGACAAGYADFLVGEKATGELLRQSASRGKRPLSLHTSLAGLMPELERRISK
jgi:hypothetical protein